jgi:hypothetical protein
LSVWLKESQFLEKVRQEKKEEGENGGWRMRGEDRGRVREGEEKEGGAKGERTRRE